MISQDKAKALKEAGLQWEPQIGDWYICIECNGEKRTGYGVVTQLPHGQYQNHIEVFAPRLDQLLAEIGKCGWKWSLNYSDGEYFMLIGKKEFGCLINKTFRADTPEDAIADALIWILTKGGLPMGD